MAGFIAPPPMPPTVVHQMGIYDVSDAAWTGLGGIGWFSGTETCSGWGISGDLRFLAEIFSRNGVEWPFAAVALDVQPIARKLLARGADVDHFNLGHVADRLGIGRMGEHSALADAYATYDVLLALMQRAQPSAGAAAGSA